MTADEGTLTEYFLVTNFVLHQGDSHVRLSTQLEGSSRAGRHRAVAFTAIGGAVATADSASEPTVTTYEVFRETVKPWDSIKIPSLMCPTGYLHNQDYSPAAWFREASRSSSPVGSASPSPTETARCGSRTAG